MTIFNKKGVDFDSFEKHLLYILMFAREYPDSGFVKTMLSDIDKRVEDWLNPKEEQEAKLHSRRKCKGDVCHLHTDCHGECRM